MKSMVIMMFRDGLYNSIFDVEAKDCTECVEKAILLFNGTAITGDKRSTVESIANQIFQRGRSYLRHYLCSADGFTLKVVWVNDRGELDSFDGIEVANKFLDKIDIVAENFKNDAEKRKRYTEYLKLKNEFENMEE